MYSQAFTEDDDAITLILKKCFQNPHLTGLSGNIHNINLTEKRSEETSS
jgi:hypothetical protein